MDEEKSVPGKLNACFRPLCKHTK